MQVRWFPRVQHLAPLQVQEPLPQQHLNARRNAKSLSLPATKRRRSCAVAM
jgi:hypothetical protein